jgi:hypothetical protein
MRILTSACLYFTAVFGVGFLLGPVRVLWLEPLLGKTAAVAAEAPFLVAAMIFAARQAPKWTGLSKTIGSLAAMGIVALALLEVADLAVAIGVRGMSVREQAATFVTPEGLIYLALVLLFAAMPVLVNCRNPAGSRN